MFKEISLEEICFKEINKFCQQICCILLAVGLGVRGTCVQSLYTSTIREGFPDPLLKDEIYTLSNKQYKTNPLNGPELKKKKMSFIFWMN